MIKTLKLVLAAVAATAVTTSALKTEYYQGQAEEDLLIKRSLVGKEDSKLRVMGRPGIDNEPSGEDVVERDAYNFEIPSTQDQVDSLRIENHYLHGKL